MSTLFGGKRRGPTPQTASAKKRKAADYEKRRQKSKINIGGQLERWNAVRQQLGLVKHEDVAQQLLDRFEEQVTEVSEKMKHQSEADVQSGPSKRTPFSTFPVSSTPAHRFAAGTSSVPMEGISEITSNDSPAVQSSLSGLDELSASSDIEKDSKRNKPKTSMGPIKKDSSFVDPFDLTIGISEEESLNKESDDDDDDDDDDEYEPSFDISIRPNIADQLDDITFEDVLFNAEDDDDDDNVDVEKDADISPTIKRITEENISTLTEDHTCLVYLDCLLNLAKKQIDGVCQVKGCKQRVEINYEFVGSALYLIWACEKGHQKHKWCSQPLLNRRMHSGDILSSAAILMSGNNFSKVALFAKFLKLHFVSASVHSRIQRVYLAPVIENAWEKEQETTLKKFKDKDLTVLGDGRMDSPGHSAQYCTYTVMENDTKKILSIVTMDKRETDRKSANLEKACFLKSLNELLEKKVKISEVVTDAHMQISSIMKKDFNAIKHSHDIWHAAKNLGKKIMKIAGQKECRNLQQWCPDVVNHFWYACKHANTYNEFLDIWYGILHHVVNEHEWVLPYIPNGRIECWHGPLPEERPKQYLEKGDAAHRELTKLVMDKRMMNKVPYYLNFRGTAELENFQQHILMYAGKRFAYTPPAYKARNHLAALDHNMNFNREFQFNKDGSKRYQRLFNKKTKRWTAVALKVPKTYDHVFSMLEDVVRRRLEDPIGINRKMTLEEGDPRRISRNLAPIPPPPTQEIVQEKVSRT